MRGEEDDMMPMLSLRTMSHDEQLIFEELRFCSGASYPFVIDTGSLESIIPMASLQLIDVKCPIKPTKVQIQGVTGHHLALLGEVELMVQRNDKTNTPVRFLVAESGSAILGLRQILQLNLTIELFKGMPNSQVEQQPEVSLSLFNHTNTQHVDTCSQVKQDQNSTLTTHGNSRTMLNEANPRRTKTKPVNKSAYTQVIRIDPDPDDDRPPPQRASQIGKANLREGSCGVCNQHEPSNVNDALSRRIKRH